MAFTYDESRAPLMVITSEGDSSDADFDAYLARMAQLLQRRQRYAILFDARRAARPTPKQRHKQADWMKTHAAALRANNAGIAFVIDNPVVRGALTAILWLQPMPAPHKIVATPEQGERWLCELLASEGLRVPPPGRNAPK